MGRMKHYYEDQVERICDCSGGISLNPKHHAADCPARELLEETREKMSKRREK